MRSVIVFPCSDQSTSEAVLDRLCPHQREPWHVDGCLHASIGRDSADLPLFLGWEPSETQALEHVCAGQPSWAVIIHMSGAVDGEPQVRSLVLALLRDGGAAIDDYSLHPWTSDEIEHSRTVQGRRFLHPTAGADCCLRPDDGEAG